MTFVRMLVVSDAGLLSIRAAKSVLLHWEHSVFWAICPCVCAMCASVYHRMLQVCEHDFLQTTSGNSQFRCSWGQR